MDGEITIGTRLDTDKFDRQISDLEKKMKKEEDKKVLVQAKLDTQEADLEKARAKTDELADAYQRLKQAQDALESGKATPGQFTTFQDLQSTYGSLEKLDTSFNKALSKQEAIEQKVAQTKYRYDEINAKVSEYKQKIENVKIEKQVSDVDKLKEGFNNVGSSIQGAVKHVARLALGIFGIRSAFMFLRRASSDLASYDKQYATNLEYIRYALTQMIAPVLRWIVNLAAKLLGYINAIMQGWFGINLFSRGSAKNFQKMKAGAGGVAKAVKEIKKQLAGFDEINMLTDQSDNGAGGGGGAGGVGMPSFDLSAMQGDVPPWLKWIIDNKELILGALAGIAAGLIAIKFGAKGILALGIGLLVGGLIYSFQSLIKYLKDPSWSNFGKIIAGIGVAISGLGLIIISVAGTAAGMPVLITGIVIAILGIIIKYWEQIKAFFQKGIDWLKGKSDWVHQMFGNVIGSIYDLFTRTLQNLLGVFDSFFKMLKGVFDGIIKFIKGVFTGNWKKAWEGIKDIFKSIWNGIKNIFKGVIKIISDMTVTVAKTTGKIISSAFKAVVNGVMWAIENILNAPIRAVNRLIGVINAVPGINLSTLPTFNLPRLKVGGIVNMPNKGTMIGGAIAGESGREGVLPLTDQQAMAELGAEIGRNVVVNLTNITKVGNRQIAREIKQINAEQEFACNS